MRKTQIVGILNVTPDSYWDGGRYTTTNAAVQQAEKLINERTDIIEIGGESTGPGSTNVSEADELARTIPIIEAIHHSFPQARLSIDTYKAEVARQAIEAGVSMVNDVTTGRADPKMFTTLAKTNAKLVLMYAKDNSPHTTKESVHYDDVIAHIKTFLAERITVAKAQGISKNRLIIDPGLGHFLSSDPRYSFEVIARLAELRELNCPIFISPSRKSFLAGQENLAAADRLPGTIAASAIAALNGATYIRTHDVMTVRRGCEIATEVLQAARST